MLYQNDGFGKDYLIGLKDGLGADHAGMIVKEASYETSEPTVDSQIVTLAGLGRGRSRHRRDAEIRRAGDPQVLRSRLERGPLSSPTSRQSIATVMKPAGLDKSKGVITAVYGKDPTDARWKDDPGFKEWQAFCDKYMTPKDFIDVNAAYGFGAAATMVQVLKQCGNDLSRENVMKQAANLKDFELPMLLPGMTINTSPTNFSPIRQMQLARFNGESWRAVRRADDRLSGSRPRARSARGLRFDSRRRRSDNASPNPRQELSKTGSAETIGIRRRSADAARKRSNGSRCGQTIVPAIKQSAASSGCGDASLACKQSRQAFDVGRHFRPFAKAHFLRDLEERNRADEDCLRFGHLLAGAVRNPPVVGQSPCPDMGVEQERRSGAPFPGREFVLVHRGQESPGQRRARRVRERRT